MGVTWDRAYVCGLVELKVQVQLGNAVHILLRDIPAHAVEVLGHDLGTEGLGDDGKAALSSPAEEDLGLALPDLGGDVLDGVVLQQGSGRGGALHVELDEASRAEGGIGGNNDALRLGELDKLVLLVVGVQLHLEGGRADLGVLEGVVEGLGLVVGDTNALGETLLDELLHGAPGLLVGGLAPADLALAIVVPAGRVADAGVDVLEGYGEVDEEEVEVVDLPVGELAAGDGLDLVLVVEGLPQLGDNEEVLTLHKAVLDGAGDTLTTLLLVAIVCSDRRERSAGCL